MIFVLASLTLFHFLYSQNSKFPDGPLLSLKLGYHTKDRSPVSYYSADNPLLYFAFKIGYGFVINLNFLVSAEAGYLGFSEFKIQGSTGTSKFFQFRTGINYVFESRQSK